MVREHFRQDPALIGVNVGPHHAELIMQSCRSLFSKMQQMQQQQSEMDDMNTDSEAEDDAEMIPVLSKVARRRARKEQASLTSSSASNSTALTVQDSKQKANTEKRGGADHDEQPHAKVLVITP